MKSISIWLIAAAGVLMALAAGCTKEHGWLPVRRELTRKAIELSCEPLDTEGDAPAETRSSHSASSLTQVSNANYYLFQNGTLVKQEYCPDIASFAVELPSTSAKYNLYLLANVGQVTIPSTTQESAMGTAVHVDYGSKSNYFSTIESNGFPMANVIQNFSAASSSRYKLKRLVHTLYVKMNTDELEKTRMTFTGLQIKQAPRDVYPFADGSKATVTMDGDAANLSSDDIALLNSGETVTLYLLENMRGDLIPGNSSWKTKIPSRISSTSERSRASYIEMTARVETVTATYDNNVYRAYLGSDAANFDVERSTYFLLNNNFTSDMVHDEDWRADSDSPTITGRLCFADTRYTYDTAPADYKNRTDDVQYRPFQEVDYFYTMKGFTAIYFIYQSNPDIDYTISVDKSSSVEPYVSYRTSRIDDHFTALMITTSMPVSTTDSYSAESYPGESGTKNVKFTVTSSDGLLSDTMTVRVLYKQLGVWFHYDGAAQAVATTDNGVLNMYMCNPMKLSVLVRMTGTVNGYVSYKPSGTMWGSQSKSPEVYIRTGGGYNVLTGPVRIDTYQDNTSFGGSYTTRAGFYQYFKDIWNAVGWDSYTLLNGSNGYNKHAHPTRLQLELTLTFDTPNSYRLRPDNGLKLPVYWVNKEYQTNSSGAGFGAGTDWGFEWDHFDNEASSSYVRYRFLKHVNTPDLSAYNYENTVPVGIKINSTEKWNTDKKGIPLGVSYTNTYFTDLGF